MPKLEDVLTREDTLAYELEHTKLRVRQLEATLRGVRDHLDDIGEYPEPRCMIEAIDKVLAKPT